MMKSLYNINREIEEVIANANIETGEIDFDALTALTVQKREKREGIAKYVLHLKNDISAIDSELKRLKAMKDSVKLHEQSLKDYLRKDLEIEGLTKLSFGTMTVSIRNNAESVHVLDESKLADKWSKEKITVSLDKVAIKQAIQSGEHVEGAELIRTQSLTIK